MSGSSDDKAKKTEEAVKEQIGSKLRQVYSEVAAEPVPDRFVELLKQLEAAGTDDEAASLDDGDDVNKDQN